MGSMNTLRWIWMHFTPRSASSSSLDAYVGGSQSLRHAKTSLTKVCIPSSHPCPPLVLISTPQCITGLRSKRSCANPGAITAILGLAWGEAQSPECREPQTLVCRQDAGSLALGPYRFSNTYNVNRNQNHYIES